MKDATTNAPGDTTADEDALAQEWAAEIERRVRAARAGEVALLDGPAVLDEVFGLS